MEVLELFDPDLDQTFKIQVTAKEKHLVLNGDYVLANTLLRKAQEACNIEVAFQLENEDDIDDSNVTFSQEGSAEGSLEGEVEVETNLEPEHFEWTKQTTKLVLQLYMERKLQFRDPKIKKKSIWRDLKNKFLEKGYKGVNEDILDRKMRNMKKRYRTIKDNQQKTGASRISWDYFEMMEEIFLDDKTVNFGETLASSPVLLPSQQALFNNTFCVSSQQAQCSTRSSISNTSCVQQENLNSHNHNLLPREVTPGTSSMSRCVTQTPKTKKALKSREVYSMRQKLKTLDETKVEELKKLRESVEENNRIQKERNEILMKLVNK
ncbi:unnamed protein product [Psylliodes chrysocephalus]|uniref:Myb/SANT-like DNA-binding domain-containing protein n=1 Tax=Psylliodes chrysocephalus TaxID=3402493 RepID=A0A9P0D4H9_9CUCU|nr:unnamed protein product [Psylliodes chrysocephala]